MLASKWTQQTPEVEEDQRHRSNGQQLQQSLNTIFDFFGLREKMKFVSVCLLGGRNSREFATSEVFILTRILGETVQR